MRFAFLPEGEDPDSYVRRHEAKGFIDALDRAMPLSDFMIEELAMQVDMESVDGRARLVELAKPLMARIPPGAYRELLNQRLAETVGLAEAKIEAILKSGLQDNPRGTASVATRLRVRKAGTGSGNPSVVRRAITLIVHFPVAAQRIDVEKLGGMSKPGAELLRELIETVQSEPNITTAGLLERFRNDQEGQHLGKLAAVEIPESDDFDAEAELADCIAQLSVAARRERTSFLIEKQRVGELSASERDELRRLTQGSGTNG